MAPDCHSNQFYKGVVDGRAMRVFAGKIIVHQDAQKTNAYQKNDNLLLSDDAEIDTKPELEIYADDVKCSHGATAGDLDPTALFYLRSRGLPRAAAESLLTFAFAAEVIERFADPTRAPSRARRLAAPAAGRRQPGGAGVTALAARVVASGLRRRARCARLPDPGDPDERPAAGLSRHGRERAEAARGDRRAQRASTSSDYANIHRGVYDLSQRATAAARRGAAQSPALHQRRRLARDRLHPQRDRGDQPRRRELPARQASARRRDPGHRDGAPRQHRALADGGRGDGCARWWRHRSPTLASSTSTAFVERITAAPG